MFGERWICTSEEPSSERLADYKPPIVSQVFGDDGSLVGEFYLERRTVVPVDKIPRKLIQAFVAAEDSRFFEHPGVDLSGIARQIYAGMRWLDEQKVALILCPDFGGQGLGLAIHDRLTRAATKVIG